VRTIGPSRQVHLVDELGLVGCPVRGADVELEECYACGQLLSVTTRPDGSVGEIRCSGAHPAPRPSSAWDGFVGPGASHGW
jgi:hypothetical protein